MTEPISVRDGYLELAERPGLGTALREEVLRRPDVHFEVTTPRDVADPEITSGPQMETEQDKQ
jgi:hypothetical protein